jgi:capsular polysaccharide transport system ATP-binding protein
MISIENVTKSYPTRHGVNVVLNQINATFTRGVNVGIVGRNGAGKSTLLRILSGAEQPDGGVIHRQGRISWPLGFSGGFAASLTGQENARFVARLHGADVDTVTASTADFAELGEYFDMPVRTYSSGMRARLAFALSMAIDFELYLVDEVTAVGDSRFQKKCRAAFRERSSRSSIIIVSHNIQTVRAYADRVAVLREGSLYFFDNVHEAIRFYEA